MKDYKLTVVLVGSLKATNLEEAKVEAQQMIDSKLPSSPDFYPTAFLVANPEDAQEYFEKIGDLTTEKVA